MFVGHWWFGGGLFFILFKKIINYMLVFNMIYHFYNVRLLKVAFIVLLHVLLLPYTLRFGISNHCSFFSTLYRA